MCALDVRLVDTFLYKYKGKFIILTINERVILLSHYVHYVYDISFELVGMLIYIFKS